MDGCNVHASVGGRTPLNFATVVVHMFPLQLTNILQTLDSDPLSKAKAHTRVELRSMLPNIQRNARFILSHLMRVIKAGAPHGLSSFNNVSDFKKTDTWPICPSKDDVRHHVLGKGVRNSARKVHLELSATRLGPGARRDMRQPFIAFGSVSARGMAL